jgi:AraC-like DNA-binding protein
VTVTVTEVTRRYDVGGAGTEQNTADRTLSRMLRPTGYTVNVKSLRGALGVATFGGLSPADILRDAGIDPAVLADADARIPYEGWLDVWRIVEERTGDRLVAMKCAQALPKGHFDVVDYVFASSEDFRTALTRFSRYFALISTAVEHRFEGNMMRRVHAPGAFTRSPFPAEFAFSAIICRTRDWTERTWTPERVEFAHTAPTAESEIEEARRLFQCKVVYDAPESAIHFDDETLRLRMRTPEPELCRILDNLANEAVERLPKATDFVATVRDHLAKELRGGSPTLDQCAKKMGMGARSLHRRLTESGTSHKKLLDEVRHHLALRYLDDRSLSIGEVGFLLGFADASAFYRAFRRWTGDRTPAQYREMRQSA